MNDLDKKVFILKYQPHLIASLTDDNLDNMYDHVRAWYEHQDAMRDDFASEVYNMSIGELADLPF